MLVWPSVSCSSFPQQACVSQLSAALLNCFGLLFSVLSKCPAWPSRGHLLALLLLCSKRLFSILLASIVSWGQSIGLIFWDWGFDTDRVTGSTSWLSCWQPPLDGFCSLGYLRGTLEKMAYCFLVTVLSSPPPPLSGETATSDQDWISPAAWVLLCHIVTACIFLSSSWKVSVRQDLFLILRFFQEY